MVVKKIDIFVKWVQKGLKDFDKQMGNNMGRFREISNAAGKANKRFKENRTVLGRLGHRIRMVTHGMRGFRMEMLGVMFFGMGLQRFFLGLLRPSLELVGIFDLLNIALGIFFLPLAMILLDLLMPIAMSMIDASEGTKLFVGWLVLGAAALATALFLVGVFALGVGSLIQVFGGFSVLKLLWPAIFGKTAFASTLTSMKGKFSSVFRFMKGLAIAGIAIKALFDLDAYYKGEKDLRQLINSFGDSLALFGLVSGKPWIIAIGLLPRLLGFGEMFSNMGKGMWESAQERLSKISDMPHGMERITESLLAGLEMTIGGQLGGIGKVLEGTNDKLQEYSDRISPASKKTKEFFSYMDSNGNPIIREFTDSVSQMNDAFNNGTTALDGYQVNLRNVMDLYSKARDGGDVSLDSGGISGYIPGIQQEYGGTYGSSAWNATHDSNNVSITITQDTDSTVRITGGDPA